MGAASVNCSHWTGDVVGTTSGAPTPGCKGWRRMRRSATTTTKRTSPMVVVVVVVVVMMVVVVVVVVVVIAGGETRDDRGRALPQMLRPRIPQRIAGFRSEKEIGQSEWGARARQRLPLLPRSTAGCRAGQHGGGRAVSAREMAAKVSDAMRSHPLTHPLTHPLLHTARAPGRRPVPSRPRHTVAECPV